MKNGETMDKMNIKSSLQNVLEEILNTKEITIHHFNYMDCVPDFYFVVATIQKEEVELCVELEHKFITTKTTSSKNLRGNQ